MLLLRYMVQFLDQLYKEFMKQTKQTGLFKSNMVLQVCIFQLCSFNPCLLTNTKFLNTLFHRVHFGRNSPFCMLNTVYTSGKMSINASILYKNQEIYTETKSVNVSAHFNWVVIKVKISSKVKMHSDFAASILRPKIEVSGFWSARTSPQIHAQPKLLDRLEFCHTCSLNNFFT